VKDDKPLAVSTTPSEQSRCGGGVTSSESSPRRQRVFTWVGAALAVVGLGGGITFGLVSQHAAAVASSGTTSA